MSINICTLGKLPPVYALTIWQNV